MALAFPAAAEATVSPRESGTDATKLKFPIGTVAAIVTTAIIVVTTQQVGQAELKSEIQRIVARLDASEAADKEIKELQQKYLEQRFAALEAKIESAGLRNANMALAQELQKRKGQ